MKKEKLHSSRKRSRKRVPARQFRVLFLAALAMSVISGCVLLFMNQAAKYVMPESGILYQYGDSYEIPKGEVLWPDKEGGDTRVSGKSSGKVLGAVPVYMGENEETMLIPKVTMYRDVRANVYGKLPATTRITVQNGPFLAEHKGKETRLDRGFVFDGSNTYLFLEPVKVSFNGRELEISACSYVRVTPGGLVEIFDYETKTYLSEEGTGEVFAISGSYGLSLSGDTLIYGENKRELLASQPEVLDSLMEE